MITIYLITIYILGCIISLLIYNIVIYEKYNNTLINKYDKKDLRNGILIMFSWLYIIFILLKFKKYRNYII